MESNLRILGLLCFLISGASCRLAEHCAEPGIRSAGDAEDVSAIKHLAEEWRRGWISGDADLLAGLYTDEPVLMPQNQPAIIGKEAIRSIYQSVFDEYAVVGGGDLLEVEVAGDWAFYRSTYELTATPKAPGEPLKDKGKSLLILRRQPDSSWRISHLIANSDQPPPDCQ